MPRRLRLAWWGVVVVLAAVAAWFVLAFVGTFALGLFFYYGARPLHRRLYRLVGRRWLAAALTLLLVVLPVVGLLGYTGLVVVQELTAVLGADATAAALARLPGDPESLGALVRSPGALLDAVESPAMVGELLGSGLATLGRAASVVTRLTLALAFAFFLLRDGPRVAAWFRADVADDDGVTEAYLSAVDADLQTVYFGNVLTVLTVGAAALAVYHGFNFLAPAPLQVPVPTLLALLTGLATFVPLVVGKLVYVPVTGYLLWVLTAAEGGVALAPWVLAFFVVSLLALDLVPMTFVQPYLAGRSLHGGLVLFAYVLGAALFGWYGLFLAPLVVVLLVQAANVVLPELLRGEPLTPSPSIDIGSDPPDGAGTGDDAGGGQDPTTDVGSGDGAGGDGDAADGAEEDAE